MSIYDEFAAYMNESLEGNNGFVTYGGVFDALNMNDIEELNEPSLKYRWYAGNKDKYKEFIKKEREHYKMKYDLYSDVASYILNKLQFAPNDGSVIVLKSIYSELGTEADESFDICQSLDCLLHDYSS